MSELRTHTVNMTEYLGYNKYMVDEEYAHIELVENPSNSEFEKLITLCPAALYQYGETKEDKIFDYAGCLECGTCRIVCGDTIIKKWENPRPTMGIRYRYG